MALVLLVQLLLAPLDGGQVLLLAKVASGATVLLVYQIWHILDDQHVPLAALLTALPWTSS